MRSFETGVLKPNENDLGDWEIKNIINNNDNNCDGDGEVMIMVACRGCRYRSRVGER